MRDPNFKHLVRVQMHNRTISWSELCSSALNLFGLPGDRFITDSSGVGYSHMDWIFREEHDALLFRLKFSEYVLDNA